MRLADDERLLVEPACGVCVQVAYDAEKLGRVVKGLGPESKVVVVVCGGSDVTVDMVSGWKEEFGDKFSRKRRVGGKKGDEEDVERVVPSDVTLGT